MTTEFDDIYGSKYLSVADLHGEQIKRRIAKVETTELKGKDGASKKRYVMYFNNVEKPLVVNKTNATKMASALGKDSSAWIGTMVELYSEMTPMGEGVRLRPIKAAADGAKAADMNDQIPF
jgi:hypothetical protein